MISIDFCKIIWSNSSLIHEQKSHESPYTWKGNHMLLIELSETRWVHRSYVSEQSPHPLNPKLRCTYPGTTSPTCGLCLPPHVVGYLSCVFQIIRLVFQLLLSTYSAITLNFSLLGTLSCSDCTFSWEFIQQSSWIPCHKGV